MKDITMLSLYEVSGLIKGKKISPVELVEEAIKSTKKYQGTVNAYITFLEDEARQAAKTAEKELESQYRGSLHGVPIALKDLFYTKGILTSAGSKLMADFKPAYDGTITKRLKAAGSILMGKTNTHEWAFGPTTEVSYYGATHNPWNTERISGGSSGGSAAAVAEGMAYMAMGTDTGGSIRIPSALCGVVGFKPTYGLCSLYGIVPLSFHLDHPGPITRSVMDTAITLDAITGYDPSDPCPGRFLGEHTNFVQELERTNHLKGVKIGIPENFYFDKADWEVEKLVMEAIDALKSLGAEIKPVVIPHLEEVPEVSTIIMAAEAAWAHHDRFAKYPDGYKPDVKARLLQGGNYKATEYIDALTQRDVIIASWEKALSEFDAIAAPSLPITAYPIGASIVNTRGKEENARDMLTRHTRLSNTTGGPALSVPCGLTAENMPVGMMLMGKNADDAMVLKIGYAYEKQCPFHFLR